MKLKQFEAILSVVYSDLNISNSAQMLGVTQPNISKLITEFEKEIGCNIFTRNGRSISGITKEGELILESLYAIRYHTQQIQTIGNEFNSYETGSLKIAADNIVASSFLPKYITKFNQKYPEVECNINLVREDDFCDNVLLNNDICLFAEKPASLKMASMIPCFKWQYVCLANTAKKDLVATKFLSLNRLKSSKLVTIGLPEDISLKYSSLQKNTELLKANIRSDNIYLAMNMVKENHSVAIVPSFSFNKDMLPDNIVQIDVPNIFVKNTAYLAFRRDINFRSFVYDFVSIINTSISKKIIDKVNKIRDLTELNKLFDAIDIKIFNE